MTNRTRDNVLNLLFILLILTIGFLMGYSMRNIVGDEGYPERIIISPTTTCSELITPEMVEAARKRRPIVLIPVYSKYKLIQDLPDLEAGAVFEWKAYANENMYTYCGGFTGGSYSVGGTKCLSGEFSYSKEEIINNGEWFEPIIE